MSRIPSRSHPKPEPAARPAVSTRLALSTPPELLSWLVDDLRYLPPSSSSTSSHPTALDPWGKARENKELKLTDVNRFCRGSIHILLHHLSLHLIGRSKASHIRSEIYRLQSPLSNSHLSRPTLQTLFPPTTSSHQTHLISLSNLSKLDARLASLQLNLDALLRETSSDERTDEEAIALKMKRDVLLKMGERWREGLGAIEQLGEMIEKEGGEEARSTLSEEEQKTQLSTLLQSVSSYIDFPSKYTEPTDLGSAMFHISPVVLLDSLCVELERSLELLSVQAAMFEVSDLQHARDALMELHVLHLSFLDDRQPVRPPRPSKRAELENRLDEKLRKQFGSDKAGRESRRTEILVQIDNRVARRTKPNLVGKLSPYGQDLLAGRVETKEKLAEAEEERISLSTEICSLQAAYDSLVASSTSLAGEAHTLASESLTTSLQNLQASLTKLEGTLERELRVVKDESWGEKVGKTLSSEEGKEREAVGKLLGLGDRVGMTFNGLHSTLSSHINERTRLSNLSNHLLASRPLIEDHSNLIAALKIQEDQYTSGALRLLAEGKEMAGELMRKTREEFEKASREREAIVGGRFLKRSAREREREASGRTRR